MPPHARRPSAKPRRRAWLAPAGPTRSATFDTAGRTLVHFGDLAAPCGVFIAGSPQVVGAVAWMRSPRLIRLLASRPVAIVVNKEPKLRRAETSERVALTPLSGGVDGFSSIREPVRVVGDATRGAHTGLMHDKFLVRLDEAGRPAAVWTGSYNLTVGASGNLENAIEIHDPAVAAEFFVEFARLWSISEPLRYRTNTPAVPLANAELAA